MSDNVSSPSSVDTNTTVPNGCVSDEDDEDFGEFEFRGESLLTLVQPELISLSHHWLAALRDHALLSLPPGIYLLYLLISIVFKA